MDIQEEKERYCVKIGPNSQVAYDPKTNLGSGGHGFVLQGVIKKDIKKKVAVKRLYKLANMLERNHVNFQREIGLLKKLDNPFILKLQLFHIDEMKNVYIVTELCSRSNLHTEIQRVSLSSSKVFKYSYQIVYAMKYMHSMKCLHRDLKPENIFLTSEDNIKIGDLGIAKQILDEDIEKLVTNTNPLGTPIYSSPQMILENKSNDKCDVWSVGCIIYEMLTSERLFISKNGESVIQIHNKFKQNKKECLKNIQDPFWHELLDKMLTYQHQNRPNFQQLLMIFAYAVGTIKQNIKQRISQIEKRPQNQHLSIVELYQLQTQLGALVEKQLKDLLSNNSIKQFRAIRKSIQRTKSSEQIFERLKHKYQEGKKLLSQQYMEKLQQKQAQIQKQRQKIIQKQNQIQKMKQQFDNEISNIQYQIQSKQQRILEAEANYQKKLKENKKCEQQIKELKQSLALKSQECKSAKEQIKKLITVKNEEQKQKNKLNDTLKKIYKCSLLKNQDSQVDLGLMTKVIQDKINQSSKVRELYKNHQLKSNSTMLQISQELLNFWFINKRPLEQTQRILKQINNNKVSKEQCKKYVSQSSKFIPEFASAIQFMSDQIENQKASLQGLLKQKEDQLLKEKNQKNFLEQSGKLNIEGQKLIQKNNEQSTEEMTTITNFYEREKKFRQQSNGGIQRWACILI